MQNENPGPFSQYTVWFIVPNSDPTYQQNSGQTLFPIIQQSPYVLNIMPQQQVNQNAMELQNTLTYVNALPAG
jgi:hypothetical protein